MARDIIKTTKVKQQLFCLLLGWNLGMGSLAANVVINEWTNSTGGGWDTVGNWGELVLSDANTHALFTTTIGEEIPAIFISFADTAGLEPAYVRRVGAITMTDTNEQGRLIRPNTGAGHGGGALHFHGVPEIINDQPVTLLIANYSDQSFTIRGTANATRGNGMDLVLHTSGVIHVAHPDGEVGLRSWTSGGNTGVMNILEEGGSHSITKTGPGTLAMDSSTSGGYSGGTFIHEGTVQFGRTGALGEGPVYLGMDGGPAVSLMRSRGGNDFQNEIHVGANPTGTHIIGTVVADTTLDHRFNNNIHLNSDLILDTNMGSTTGGRPGLNFNGDFVGSHTITKTGVGIVRFSGDNTDFSGGIVIQEGVLEVGFSSTASGVGQRGSLGSGNVVNHGELRFHRVNDLVVTNNISGTGSVVQAETGRTVLTGSSTYTGTTVVERGALFVDGSVAGTATVSVDAEGQLGGTGSITSPQITVAGILSAADIAMAPGELSVNGNLTLESSAHTFAYVAGASVGEYSRISGIENFILNGTVTLVLTGFAPEAGDVFQLFDWSGSMDASAFDLGTDLVLPSLEGELAWITDEFLTSGSVSVIPEPSTAVMALLGLGVVAGFVLRRRV